MDLSDGCLFDRWREHRDGDAFAELARRHSPVVFDLTVRVLGDRAGAEDVLQEALLDLALEETRRPVEVGVVAWLCRFAVCRARNRRASERCRTRRQIAVGSERPEEVMPEEHLAHSDELERALAGCDAEDRALLAMRFLHDWDYDRIAAALSISEGAARVRVHRALSSVRARLGADERAAAGRLALAPLVPLPDAFGIKIGSVIEIAKVRLGAAPNGVEHATASSRGLRLALRTAGAALALLVAAGSASIAIEEPQDGRRDAASAGFPGTGASGDAGSAVAVASRSSGFAPRTDVRLAPRPEDWDLGALARLADAAAPRSAAGPSTVAVPADARPAVPQAAADAPRAEGPAVPVEHPGLPDALRPTDRAACAAKGGSDSSDDERAGAFGGSGFAAADAAEVRAADEAPRAAGDAGRVVAAADAEPHAPRARRTAPPVERVPFDTLSDGEKALVAEAQDLLRKFVDAHLADADAADAAPRRQVRAVKSKVVKLRRAAAAGGASDGGSDAPVASTARRRGGAVTVNQVVSLLAVGIFSDASAFADVRWPRGVDAEAALREVISLLSAATAAAPDAEVVPASLPDGTAGVE